MDEPGKPLRGIVGAHPSSDHPSRATTPPRARTSHRPYYGRAWQAASWHSRGTPAGRPPHPRARTSHRPYYGRAWQAASWHSRGTPAGRPPHPGRGQAIAPTMDEPGKPLRGIVGAHPCGRPVRIASPLALPAPERINWNQCTPHPPLREKNERIRVLRR